LQIYQNEHGTPASVAAPGIRRLPFFFPTAAIQVDNPPTRLDQLNDITYFIYGTPETPGTYSDAGAEHNQILAGLALAGNDERAILRRAWWEDDGNFNYVVYELHLDRRFTKPKRGVRPKGDTIFGGFARYLGHDIGGSIFSTERKIAFNMYWQVISPPTRDYMMYIHLTDANGKVWEKWDGPVSWTNDGNYYSTLFWQTGEYISDSRIIRLTSHDTPVGEGYKLVIGLYDLQTGERVPITVDGQAAGNGFTIPEKISVIDEPPS
jgi:hypothetical protein